MLLCSGVRISINEASDVISSVFMTHRSLRADHSYYGKSPSQVRVVIPMTTGREKIEQDVLAVLFAEEGREVAGARGERGE